MIECMHMHISSLSLLLSICHGENIIMACADYASIILSIANGMKKA